MDWGSPVMSSFKCRGLRQEAIRGLRFPLCYSAALLRLGLSLACLRSLLCWSPGRQQPRTLCLSLNLDLVQDLSMACIRLCDTECEVALVFRIHRPSERH